MQLAVVRAVPGLIEAEPTREPAAEPAVGAIKFCHQEDAPAIERLARGVGHVRWRETSILRLVIQEAQSDLLEVADALAGARRFARIGDCAHQPRHRYTCERDDSDVGHGATHGHSSPPIAPLVLNLTAWQAEPLVRPFQVPASSSAHLSGSTMDHPFHFPVLSRARVCANYDRVLPYRNEGSDSPLT